MSLTISVPPGEEPITAEEQMTWSRITDGADAAVIEKLIKAAREQCEFYTGRAFLTQTCVERFHCFPCDFELDRAPVQSITSITYIDTDGAEQTLSPAAYDVDLYSLPARICPAYGYTWPVTYPRQNAVVVTYVAGWASVDDVPEGVKQAISLMADFKFDNPTAGSADTSLPCDVTGLLHPYKVYC